MSGCINFSKLKVGQQVLGVIKAVNDFDLVISLPNQLVGFVTCDRISRELSNRLTAVSEATTNAGTGEASSTNIPALNTFYRPGEIVLASIVTIESPKTGGRKKRIELSLKPELVNKSVAKDAISNNMVLVGEVKSHEDRGYTIDFGLDKDSIGSHELMGFLPDSEATCVSGIDTVILGKSIPFFVNGSFDVNSGRVVTLTTRSETALKNKPNLNSFTCGTLVQAKIKAIKEGKLQVTFCGYEGRIDILNLPDSTVLKRHKDLDLAEYFPVGKELKARIAHVDFEEKHFHLTCIQSIINWSCPFPSTLEPVIGEKFNAVTVLRIDTGLGVLVSCERGVKAEDAAIAIPSMEEKPILSYIHISRLADSRIERIEGPYRVGSKHEGRIVDYDAFSGLYQASLQPSILKETILRIEDIHPGQVVRGELVKIEPFGLIVAITERIRAICPTFHLTEMQTDQALKMYHVGQKYKFRVVDCDPKTRRITLTRKKGLLDSSLTMLSDYKTAVVGNFHDGYIVAIKNFGCIVRFFGDVKGILTIAELADEYVDRPQDSFFVGQVVKCRVVKCDPASKELALSLRKTTGPKVRPEKRKMTTLGDYKEEGVFIEKKEKVAKKQVKTIEELLTATV